MLETIDQVKINFNQDQLFLLNICLGFLMFGVALDLRVDNFRQLLERPKPALVGLTSQWILLPLITLILILVLRPPVSIALGMLMVSACPGGNVSNFAVYMARGNAELSVLMTTLSTLAAILFTPVYFTYFSHMVPGSDAFRQTIYVDPQRMVLTIFQLILVPLLIGMYISRQFPGLTKVIKQPIKILSMVIFLAFVVVAIFSNLDNLLSYIHLVFLMVFLHNSLALLTGYVFARRNRLTEADARAISIETGIQNSGLGLILIFNFFDGLGGMALIAASWGIWHLISGFCLAMWWGYYKDAPQASESV